MHQQYYDTHDAKVKTWQEQAAPSEKYPYGLGLDSDEYVIGLGIYPYREIREDCDELTQELVPDSAPVIVGSEAVLTYRPVALPPKSDTRTLDEHKGDAKIQATSRRWTAETGGLTLPDGTRIDTGIDDQNRIASALQGMNDAGITEVDFKSASGWAKLTKEQLTGIAGMIAVHVQSCFSRERALHEAIDAVATMEELQAIDVKSGWPE